MMTCELVRVLFFAFFKSHTCFPSKIKAQNLGKKTFLLLETGPKIKHGNFQTPFSECSKAARAENGCAPWQKCRKSCLELGRLGCRANPS